MPKYLVRVRARIPGKNRSVTVYGVYSTITDRWVTPFVKDLREFKRMYPMFRHLKPVSLSKVFGRGARATIEGRKVVLKYRVYEFKPKRGRTKGG